MDKRFRLKFTSALFAIIGIVSIYIGVSITYFNYASENNNQVMQDDNSIAINNIEKTQYNDSPVLISYTKIPTYNQKVSGYPLGCEGVSLFMALKGLGYIQNYDLDSFMATMPIGKTPYEGFMGNPKIRHVGENIGKRTTIYPEPLAKWASKFANSKDLTGASVDILKNELSQGHVLLVFVTDGWNDPYWKQYPWSRTSQGEVENNHCLCIVGFDAEGNFLVNDCHDGRVDGRQGEYWVNAEKFAKVYNIRKYAISVF